MADDDRDSAPDAAILQQLFRDSPMPIAIYDLDGEIKHYNDAHETFASALGDAAGIGLLNALRDVRSERGGHRAPFQRAVTGDVVDYAFTVRPSGADPLHFHRLLLPTWDAQRRATSIVSVIVDVSEWLHAERDRARLQAELQQAQKTEGLGLLAGSIAHDFNNLLVGVLGNVSLLLDALEEDSKLARIAKAIELAARRAADVASQLLAYAGKGQFRVEELNLSELARETSELLRITIDQRAELRMELSAALSPVKADATQMRQVVMNLITNARDAVSQGGTITLRTGQLPASRIDFGACFGAPDPHATSFVFLEVEDTGPGMDVQTAARIFDPFFTTKPQGRGLGLSAVLGIVRGHGGAISVVSAPGRGTSMRVLLPAAGPVVSNLKLVAGPALDGRPAPRAGHILVVDDDEAVRGLLATMLKRLGYSVTCASNAREAVGELAQAGETISTVMLDMTMPDQDGSATFARLRELRPELPIIFMSGYEARSVPAANGFLHKPFTLDQLRQVLRNVLET